MSGPESAADRLAEAAPVGLVLVDAGCRILHLNARAEMLFGRSRRKLAGVLLAECGPAGAAAAALALRAMAEEREVFAHDLTLEGEEGAMRLAVDAAPEGEGACIVLRPWPDTTSVSRGDAAASAAAGFGRMLAHELKNPLAGARGAAQLIAAGADDETRELAGLIMTETDRARRIAERWCSIGDIAPQAFEPVNLHALVREAVRSAAAGAGGAVRWVERFDPSLPDALADRDLVLQAVLNLLVNAAEALEPSGGGEVEVITRYRQPRPGAPAPEARLEIAVSDNGPGVPEALREAVFNPFVTGKPAGEGLGLALTARIAELHGGGVAFDSRPGRTVFRLYVREAGSHAP
ncbi:PAS domain-containing protein [Alkalicaulis satelles]|uniref:histidine kinase n=1 Tax=Alkalicaulis satelles TaxID=2609175 RepID=A0A5M6ZM73_9PROT|nr:ATP-binding protein [Alkalicaulis satelles]KAA5804787.1 PAS domain-containing protein [Alkalicaulis satelles]